MDNRSVILKRLRTVKGFTLKDASVVIGCSTGWLSAIENCKGKCTLSEVEYKRILKLYEADNYKSQIHGWLSSMNSKPQTLKFEGVILKHFRKKAGLTLVDAHVKSGLSISHIANIENGYRIALNTHRSKLLAAYGFSPETFNNYCFKPSVTAKLPCSYRIRFLLAKLTEMESEEVLKFIFSLLSNNKNNPICIGE